MTSVFALKLRRAPGVTVPWPKRVEDLLHYNKWRSVSRHTFAGTGAEPAVCS